MPGNGIYDVNSRMLSKHMLIEANLRWNALKKFRIVEALSDALRYFFSFVFGAFYRN